MSVRASSLFKPLKRVLSDEWFIHAGQRMRIDFSMTPKQVKGVFSVSVVNASGKVRLWVSWDKSVELING